MANLFNCSEIIEFAVKIEQNGYRFYTEALSKIKDKKIEGLFTFLAAEESRHEKVFKQLLADLGSFAPHETYEGEYEAYRIHLLKSHSLGDDAKLQKYLSTIKKPSDAIQVALEFEKDSIVFFSSMKKYVSGHRDKIEEIVQEEVGHIIKIKSYQF